MKMKSSESISLKFYGITKDPKTKEFIMIVELASIGNLRRVLSTNFKIILWDEKIGYLYNLLSDLTNLHKLEYCHRDFHSGNVLRGRSTYLSDFGLSSPADEQKS